MQHISLEHKKEFEGMGIPEEKLAEVVEAATSVGYLAGM